MLRKVITLLLIPIFNITSLGPLSVNPAFAESVIDLPKPGTMVLLTPRFNPPIIKGITIYPNNPLQFDFIINQGDRNLTEQQLRQEGLKMVKYFMASMTIPNKEMWVNLSPLEKNRIIGEGLGHTAMGRDLLAEDYMLKQLSASMMDPNGDIGKKFWNKVYKVAREQFGTTNIPVNTFNKVWIVPDRAVVVETNHSAFVAERHLKVMLEEDYLLLSHHVIPASHHVIPAKAGIQSRVILSEAKDLKGHKNSYLKNDMHLVSSQLMRNIIIPALEKEVNEGTTFATVRQVYNAMILATWYKQNLKETLLARVYANKNKTRGVDINDQQFAEKIYKQYLMAFKKGVVNFIREEPIDIASNSECPVRGPNASPSVIARSEATKQSSSATITRKYFSGGLVAVETVNRAQLSEATSQQIAFIKGQGRVDHDFAMTVKTVEMAPTADKMELINLADEHFKSIGVKDTRLSRQNKIHLGQLIYESQRFRAQGNPVKAIEDFSSIISEWFSKSPQNILFVLANRNTFGSSAHGEKIIQSHVLANLLKMYPQAQVTVATNAANIFNSNRVAVIDNEPETIEHILKEEDFDLVVM